uniref:ATP-binding protein n=1 Tax=Nonomuraea montanisoli TaxID=2741721 RepID=UPI0038B39754
MAVKAGVANHVVRSRPEEAYDALKVIETVSRSALVEMRHLLGILRSKDDPDRGPLPRLTGIRELAERARLAGVEVELDLRFTSSGLEGDAAPGRRQPAPAAGGPASGGGGWASDGAPVGPGAGSPSPDGSPVGPGGGGSVSGGEAVGAGGGSRVSGGGPAGPRGGGSVSGKGPVRAAGASRASGGGGVGPGGGSQVPGGGSVGPGDGSRAPGGSLMGPEGGGSVSGRGPVRAAGASRASGGGGVGPGGGSQVPGGGAVGPGGESQVPGGSSEGPEGGSPVSGGRLVGAGGGSSASGGGAMGSGGRYPAPQGWEAVALGEPGAEDSVSEPGPTDGWEESGRRRRGARERRLPEGVELSTYRIVQEALTNVARHAAPARCRVSVVVGSSEVRIEVTNDRAAGCGVATGNRGVFVESVPTGSRPGGSGLGGDEPAMEGAGHGLIGMRERVTMFGGVFEAGTIPGGGFRVLATLPYGSAS